MNLNLNLRPVVGTAPSSKVIETFRKDPPNEPRPWNANAPIDELLGANKTHTVDDSYFGVADTSLLATGSPSESTHEISQPSASAVPVFKFATDIIDATLKVVDHAASLLVTPNAVDDINDLGRLVALENQISGFLHSAEQTILWLTNAVMRDALISSHPQAFQSWIDFVNQKIWDRVRAVQNNEVGNPETRQSASTLSASDIFDARPRSAASAQGRNHIDSLRAEAKAVDSGQKGASAFVPVNLIVLAYRLSHIRVQRDMVEKAGHTQ